MERILVAFEKNEKKYGWIIGFSGVDVLIELYNDTHFEIVPARLTEKVYSYFFYEGFDDEWHKEDIENAIRYYEMTEEERMEAARKAAEENSCTPSSSTYNYPGCVDNNNRKY